MRSTLNPDFNRIAGQCPLEGVHPKKVMSHAALCSVLRSQKS